MSGLRADAREKLGRWSKESFSTLWKTALVRLPRAVPLEALYLTNPNGPLPYKLLLPSRHSGKTVQVFVFLPPVTFPSQDSGSTEPTPNSFPVVMDYHGGGFYLGSCLEQAPFCSRLCRELNAIVIGVDYRMAPFDKFPAAIEDADDVVQSVLNPQWPGYDMLRQSIASFYQAEWFGTIGSKEDREKGKVPTPPTPTIHLDSTRIAFSGASSGGNIALNMGIDVDATMGMPSWPCPIPADYPHPVPLLLLYPALDLRQLPGERHLNEKMTLAKSKKGEKKLDIDDHLAATYVSREMAGHPRASPGLVNTVTALHKNAKILLILTGLDTLWEQSEIWTKKVEAEGRGKDMKTMRYEDRKHGWTQIPEIALSKEERRTRLEVLDECVRFTDLTWRGKNPVEVMERENGENVAAQGDDALKARDQQL